MKRLGHGQDGAVALMLMIGVMGVCLMLMHSMSSRATRELDRELARELRADQGQVLAAFRDFATCPPARSRMNCAAGHTLNIPDRFGNPLISMDGDRKIGRWNVKVQCEGGEYKVFLARLNQGQAGLDPLTKKPQEWKAYKTLQQACNGIDNAETKMERSTCYGSVDGAGPLPDRLKAFCGARCKDKYCTDNQLQFPDCQPGYSPFYRYSDRYGWGGIDLSKYTLCRKIN